jgi:tRNA-dihydrouridine synthase B
MKLPPSHPLRSKKHPLVLAPMADLTHAALRVLINRFGHCDFYFTEMISAGALCSGGKYEPYYMIHHPCPERTAAQLVGNDPVRMTEASRILIEQGFTHIDINMGCCAPDILRRQQGAALLKDLPGLFFLVEYMRERLPEGVYLSAKIRLGEQKDPDQLLYLAKGLEERGISFLTLHPKTIKEKAARPAHWEMIKPLKLKLDIPLIANGGIQNAEQCIEKEKASDADAVMIGRTAVQKPWIFKEISLTRTGEPPSFRISLEETASHFFSLLKEYQPEDFWFSRAKRFSLYYHKNLKYGYSLHHSCIQNAETLKQIEDEYKKYFLRNPEEVFLT